MKIELSKAEAKILYEYMKGKKISSVREYIVLQDIVSRLEREGDLERILMSEKKKNATNKEIHWDDNSFIFLNNWYCALFSNLCV